MDSEVDVVVVGAGPAGLMLANWMSRTGIKTRIFDKRGTKVFNGQADGMQSRTLEIFDSFDFAHRAWRESNHMLEMCLWNPDPTGKLHRADRVIDTIQNLSRFQQAVLHQGRIERFLLDSIEEHSSIRVERLALPESLHVDGPNSHSEYPITLNIRHLAKDPAVKQEAIANGLFRSNLAKDDTEYLLFMSQRDADRVEVVKAKYLVGCDGAHSWVRKQLGAEYALVGDSTDYVWGVLDIVPITNFPDIRTRCAIHSENSGSMMIIPRENRLTRLYIQLSTAEKADGAVGARVDRSNITPETIIATARKIIAPYELSYQHCDWWTVYQIGQRVGNKFSHNERVFLAGDAVHTHSPKAGQGMNVSMQDTYNLGWKIAQVVKGYAQPDLLRTYELERRKVAQDLIAFDHYFSRLFSGRPTKDVLDEGGIDLAVFKRAFEQGNMFTSGIGVTYASSMIVAKDNNVKSLQNQEPFPENTQDNCVKSRPELASKVVLGMRMPSFKILNQADARPWHLQELLKSDGRWRLLVFAGNIKATKQMDRIQRFASSLSQPSSFLHRYKPAGKRIDSLIEVLTIHSSPRTECTIFDLPDIFHPYDDEYGWDYWKIYVDDESYHEGHGHAYDNYGIDSEVGCVLIVRPDQYVSWIGSIDDISEMDRFFSGVLLDQGPRAIVGEIS